MIPVGNNILKTLFLLKVCLLSAVSAFAQTPEIKNVDKVKGSLDQTIMLKGSSFGTDATKLAVTFGATRADIVSVTDQVLSVRVPAGATYDNISVSNTTSGRTGYTREQFLLSFNSPTGFDPTRLQGQFDFPVGPAVFDGLYDLCMCDFDGNQKTDVATANDNSAFLNVYENTSTGPGNVNFGVKHAINILSKTLHVKCGDLNGDGKPDLVATESGTNDKVFILRNASSGAGNFAFNTQSITLTGKRPKRIEIADLDRDGRPEIILSTEGSKSLTILNNQSTAGAISFSPTAITVNLTGGTGSTGTDGLAVEDLNGDLLPEIVVSQNQVKTNIFVIANTSIPGAFNLAHTTTINTDVFVKNIRIGDLDNDGKADIAFTELIAAPPVMNIVLNQSTSSALSFGTPQKLETDDFPWGLDLGDLDGDGKADIVVASITKKTLTIFNNQSTPGNLSFQRHFKGGLNYIGRHVNIGDVDRDGKPDIVYTSIDNSTTPASKVSVFRNATCMIPEVTPAGPLNVCTSLSEPLVATKGGGVTYEWLNLTASTTTPGTNEFTPTVSGDYQVRATSEGGACTPVSNIVKVTISPGSLNNTSPTFTNDGPVCLGNTVTLSTTNQGAGFTYRWSGPEGYSATTTVANGATRTNMRFKDAGEYSVDIITPGGCVAGKGSTTVIVIDVPEFRVGFSGSDVICQGDLKALSVSPNSPDFTYKWFETTAGDLSVPGPTHTVGATGEYFVKATAIIAGCPDVQSDKVKITAAAPPTAIFTAPPSACKGQEVTFTNQSTFDPATTVFYAWTFGDGGTSTDEEPAHIYAATGTRSVNLTVSYKDNACARSATNSINITDAPTVAITSDDNKFDLCPGATLNLAVSGGPFDAYEWNTGETTPAISVDEPGDYFVEVKTDIGCDLKAVRVIGAFPEPVVSATVTPESIEEGQSAQLNASGLLSFVWAPEETVSDPALPNPVATPLVSTVYTVSGEDSNGCTGTATVELKVKGEAIVTKLTPSNFFSPNGDEVSPYWTVEKIDEYPQCGIVIYDDKGVKVHDAKPYQNDWDGTFNGKKLPDGVYYYVIRCDGEESQPRMGSITILR